jgi:DHA2 family multidrug resistance protein
MFFATAISFILVAFNEGQNKGWDSSYIHICELLSAAGFFMFFLFEPFISHPLIDFKIFKNYNFSIITSINAIRAIALFGSLFIIPVYLENIMDYTPYMTGLIMMPSAISVALAAPIFGRGADRWGPKYFIVFGMALTAISLFLYWNLSVQSSLYDIIYPSIIRGIGLGMLYSPIMSTGLNSVKKEQIPEASGLLPVTMRLASGFGIAYFANYLATKKVYYLTRYGDKINDRNFTFLKAKSLFNNNGLFKSNVGVIANSARINPGLGIIDNITKMFATIQSYDDVFIVAGVICLIGIIPALMLKNKVHR